MRILNIDRRIRTKQLEDFFKDLSRKIWIGTDNDRLHDRTLPEILIARFGD